MTAPLKVRAGDRFVDKVWPWGSFPPGSVYHWSNCWIRLDAFVDISLTAIFPGEIADLNQHLRATPVYFADHGDRIELFPTPDRDMEIVGR